jgi:redox-sensitive bicupin YhaK (pirin superfamily)
VVDAGARGFGFTSPDGKDSLFIHWLVQADYYTFVGQVPPAVPTRETFTIGFAGLQLDATLSGIWHSSILVDYSESRLTLLDAYVEARFHPAVVARLGKFETPLTEERLTPKFLLPWISTNPASFLIPVRTLGAELLGDVGEGVFQYNAALVNGSYDGAITDNDVDSFLDVMGRVYVHPFKPTHFAPLANLGLNAGASYGVRNGTPVDPETPILRTYGNATFFSYQNTGAAAGTVLAKGEVARITPEITWAWGPVAAYADYVREIDHFGATAVTNDAWGATATFALGRCKRQTYSAPASTGTPSTASACWWTTRTPRFTALEARRFGPTRARSTGAVSFTCDNDDEARAERRMTVKLRRLESRERGSSQGFIRRLVAPGGLGARLKPFVLLDHVGGHVKPGTGFGMHPHSGIATLTYHLDADVTYEDSVGQRGLIRARGLEWLSAGGGTWHQGFIHPLGAATTGFQLWVALPPGVEDGPAAGVYLPPDDVPQVDNVRVLLGKYKGATNPIPAPSPMTYFDVTLARGEEWTFQPPPEHRVAWAYVYEGSVLAGDAPVANELVVFEQSDEGLGFQAEQDARFLVGTARQHAHPLVLGNHSVHTNTRSLSHGLARIREVGERLREEGRL